MENRSLINTSSDANFQAMVNDGQSQLNAFATGGLREEGWNSIAGDSRAFMEVTRDVVRTAETDSPVLLTGEYGTGKELVAAAIHNRSTRRDQPFVPVNCASNPDSIETEVFGRDRRGLFEEADNGTIFLKEITETTTSFQEKLVRVMQTGEITRAGSDRTLKVNVRVIAASNRNVDQEVAAERFSNDLFNCLSAVSIVLPPLRERSEDIPSLARRFADRVYSLTPAVKFSDEALALLEKYNWPGNIRELENAVVRAVALCDGAIYVKDLPERVRNYSTQDAGDQSIVNEPAHDDWVTLSIIEGRYVARVLEHTGGNKQAAARVLAVDRKTLDRMIKRHHIDSNHLKALRGKAVSRI